MDAIPVYPAAMAALLALMSASYFCQSNPVYPSDVVDKMIQDRNGNDTPVADMIIIVTGSTSGLGKMIASKLYEMGATIIVASRCMTNCQKTVDEIKARYPLSTGKLEVGIVDTSDLSSVASFAKNFLEGHSKLHALINNAGIHYVSTPGNPMVNLDLPMKSPQGYDTAFATNYLGHFLLTELLVPIISKSSQFGTIVNVASSYHFLGCGDMLKPQLNDGKGPCMPFAARSLTGHFFHRELQYGNNKLAQVLHAKELQRRLKKSKTSIRTVSICPGWVNTAMLPNNIGGRFVGCFAYRVEEGILSTMCGLFGSDLSGGEFLGNSKNIWASQTSLFSFAERLGVKRVLCTVFAMWLLLFQKMSYGKRHIEPSSPDSLNEELGSALYDWSLAEVSAYL